MGRRRPAEHLEQRPAGDEGKGDSRAEEKGMWGEEPAFRVMLCCVRLGPSRKQGRRRADVAPR